MIPSNNPTSQPTQAWQLLPMLLGTICGLIVFFLLSSGGGKPEWGPLWKIRPLVVLLLSGAFWGVCYNLLLRQKFFSLTKPMTTLLGLVGLMIGMWMGVVVGFDGTMWD